ncbi:MAG: deoxyribodipyrimidine photolyase-related protein [Vicingaceae bacterium]|jgi:deoxyribodipyrimidine photolyase-related protein
MSKFADVGRMTSKPSISGSHYLMKMSSYKKGKWQNVWDGLFWRFMHRHHDFFLSKPLLVRMFDKMAEETQQKNVDNV